MSVKIQINSLAALERLIGGESKLELELRHSVCVAFAERYLTPIVKTEEFQAVLKKYENAIEKAAKEEIKNYLTTVSDRWRGEKTLSQQIKKLIRDQVNQEIDLVISTAVLEAEDEIKQAIRTKLDVPTVIENITASVEQSATKAILHRLAQQKEG